LINYVGNLTEEETAELLSTGAGFLGSNFDYLVRTHRILLEQRITDRKVERLVGRCACRRVPHGGMLPTERSA
jgi:cation transport regulator ChaC